jgi:hypothetical protein
LRVADPIAAERHLGLAAEGFDVLAQRGDLERLAFDHQRHGAVRDSGRHALDPGGLGAADHRIRQRGGGDVDIADRKPQQHVAHRTADHARLLAVTVEQTEHPRRRPGAEPRRLAQPQRRAHFCSKGISFPGMKTPFSTRAGT